MIKLMGLLILLSFTSGEATIQRRIGDTVLVRTIFKDDSKPSSYLDGTSLCQDGVIWLDHPARLEFDGKAVTSQFVMEPSVVFLEAHEAEVTAIRQVVKASESEFSNNKIKVEVKWSRCSFDKDEILPLQVLLGFGSIASIVAFVAILLDFRSDKFS